MNSLSDGLLEEKSTMSSAPLCCGPGYSSPTEAMKAPREKLLYTIAIYVGTGVQKPDYLATIDADPASPTYSQVISRCEMPGTGDELHHMGWNACSSCHGDDSMERRFLIVPGVRSSNLHIIDCATDPRNPKLHMVISGQEIKEKTNLSAPHTVHCLGSEIIISMLGDAKGNAPGGFLHLNKDFEILGRWENDLGGMKFNYDFWYQPRHNVMVSSEWAAPNTFMPGFDLEDVGHLKYGREIHFWNFENKKVENTVYLGEDGLVPLEVRFHHNPVMSGQVWMGGLLKKAPTVNDVDVAGGPQMIQLSLDGKRLYVTTSLFSTWDNQFYPEIRHKGGVMLMIDCDTENGGMEINKDFVVDFGKEPNGPSRCHETRYPGGDCTSDIWI